MPECLHPRCDEEIPKGKHACRFHWRQLPKEIKDSILGVRFAHGHRSLLDGILDAQEWYEQQEKTG